MARILIVDDEEKIRTVLREYAEFEGHECAEAEDGMQAVKLAKSGNFDIVIMDVMMPKLDGYYAVKEIRKFSSVPVIMLSARVEEYDRLFGFEVGVDDYVTKPFSPKEVMARIGAVLKRANPVKSSTIVSGGLEIDMAGRNVYVDGRKGQYDAQGIRAFVLSCRKQGDSHFARAAFKQRLGLRFLRGRPDGGHAYKNAALLFRQIPR